MPSTESARRIIQSLKHAGISVVATLPDAALVALINEIDGDNDLTHIPLTREEEGVGVCTGVYLAGRRTALLMQGAGFLNSCNALTTTALQFEIPMLLLVLYAGGIGDMAFPMLGQVTEPVLKALGLPTYILSDLDDAQDLISGALVQAYNMKKPVAILLDKAVL
jgi:sulfopyruvate decarboxylase subunit alpha